MSDFIETLYDGYTQGFRVEKVYFERKTEHQHLLIFHNAHFGRVMVLDGVVQTTERDEFVYHEMLTHVPLLAHGAVRRVLVIGGGDGGMLREVLKHQSVETVCQVEIDRDVIDMSRTHLPNHSAGAFDDPRVVIEIDDGMHFVAQTDRRFDVIISDSTDPIGPGEVLFSREFYSGCQRCLAPGGIVVTQNGVVFLQPDECASTAGHFRALVNDWHFYSAAVPTYVGGVMVFGFASDEVAHRKVDLATLAARFEAADLSTRYYTPEIHQAAFALPAYVMALIGKETT